MSSTIILQVSWVQSRLKELDEAMAEAQKSLVQARAEHQVLSQLLRNSPKQQGNGAASPTIATPTTTGVSYEKRREVVAQILKEKGQTMRSVEIFREQLQRGLNTSQGSHDKYMSEFVGDPDSHIQRVSVGKYRYSGPM